MTCRFLLEKITDHTGVRHWVLYEYGTFWNPTAIIDDTTMRRMAEKVLGVHVEEIRAAHNVDLPEALTSYRKRNGMSQQELADAAGISRGNLSSIERGLGNPTQRTKDKLMAAIGMIQRG